MALLKASAMATLPFWSEYRILAWEPTTCNEKQQPFVIEVQEVCVQPLRIAGHVGNIVYCQDAACDNSVIKSWAKKEFCIHVVPCTCWTTIIV